MTHGFRVQTQLIEQQASISATAGGGGLSPSGSPSMNMPPPESAAEQKPMGRFPNIKYPLTAKGILVEKKKKLIRVHFDDVLIKMEDVDLAGFPLPRKLTAKQCKGVPEIEELVEEEEEQNARGNRGNVYHACPFCLFRKDKPGFTHHAKRHAYRNVRAEGLVPCGTYRTMKKLFIMKKVHLKDAEEYEIESQKGRPVELADRKLEFFGDVINAARENGFEDHNIIKLLKALFEIQ